MREHVQTSAVLPGQQSYPRLIASAADESVDAWVVLGHPTTLSISEIDSASSAFKFSYAAGWTPLLHQSRPLA